MLEVDTEAISWLVSNKEYSLYHAESQVTPDKSYWRNDTEQVMAEQAMVEDGWASDGWWMSISYIIRLMS